MAGQCRPVSWNDGSAVGQFSETLAEQALPLVHDEVDVELDAVEVLLQQQIVAGAEDHIVLGTHDAPHQRVDPWERLQVVHPDAPDGARTELGLHDRREAHIGGCGEQLVE